MDNSWAVVGAKCQYIGPSKIYNVLRRLWVPTPLNKHDIYMVSSVGDINLFGISVYITLQEAGFVDKYAITMFRPLNAKDVELFNSLLKVKPTDLPLIEAERELERSIL